MIKLFDHKPMNCYSNYVQLHVLGQPDDLEKLTVYGVRTSVEDPSMVNR